MILAMQAIEYLPAAIAVLSTMSSVAAMLLTILATEIYSDDPYIARSTISATVNIHLIGDCFAIPIFAFAVLKNYGTTDPTFSIYLTFALYFVLANFPYQQCREAESLSCSRFLKLT